MSSFGDATTHFRILDCQQCFQAEGIMCHPEGYRHDLVAVKSGKVGLGICCKPDSTLEQCEEQSG